MEFMRKNVGQLISINRATNQYYGSPLSIMYTCSMGNPKILKTEMQPCRHPFTRWS